MRLGRGKYRFHFRWKYAISAFLVCGVLSLTIGGPKAPDSLAVELAEYTKKFDEAFKVDKGPGAKEEDLDAPDERTIPETSPVLIGLVNQLKIIGEKINSESIRRNQIVKKEVRELSTGINEIVSDYTELQKRLYRNYMRLAHDAKFKTFKAPSMARYALDYMIAGGGSGLSASGHSFAARKDLERWIKLNEEEIKIRGPRDFSPEHFDFLNLKIDPQAAQDLYTDSKINKQFNLRNIKDENTGKYDRVEVFLNSYEKQMAEYEAISDPNSKEEYLKLIQFSGVIEAMTNRWAMRRMVGANIKNNVPMSLSDAQINSCAPDLVSFRLKSKGNLNDIEAYESLWQGDRHTDLIKLGSIAAAEVTLKNPLLSDLDYAELYRKYISDFSYYKKDILENYEGNINVILSDFAEGFSPKIRQIESTKWSKSPSGEEKPEESVAVEVFYLSNYPSDDLSITAVAKRYADKVFQTRKLYLIGAIYQTAHESKSEDKLVFPETDDVSSLHRAGQIVDEFLKERELKWKNSLALNIEKALRSKLGMDIRTQNGNPSGTGYLSNQNQSRYDAYIADLKPVAEIGVRGILNRDEAIKAQKKLKEKLNSLYTTPTVLGASQYAVADTGSNKTSYYKFPKLIDRKNPNEYLGYAPFRQMAKESGISNIILPENPNQLAIFFRKKIEDVLSYDNKDTKYLEPVITEKIANNTIVMLGMDKLFAAFATAMPKLSDKATHEEKVAALESILIPTAKTAYQEFLKGLSEPPVFVSPERAAREMRKQYDFQKVVKDFKTTEQIKNEEAYKAVHGYYRPGRNRALDKKGGEFYLETEKERTEAKKLYREALAMIGIAEEVTQSFPGEVAIAGFHTKDTPHGPSQVVSWVTTEHLIHQKLGRVRLIERIVSSVSDQMAMGKVLIQDSISRKPILTLQSSWKWKNGEEKEPILLEKLAKIYSAKNRWGNESEYHSLLNKTFMSAVQNDQGKVETFCQADIKNYRRDDSFRMLFSSLTGVRGMLSTEDKLKGWDESIRKESRMWDQAILEDYINPNQTYIMIAIGLVVAAQIAFMIGTGGAGAATTPAAAAEISSLVGLAGTSATATSTTIATQLALKTVGKGIAKFVFLQMTGNLGFASLVFTFQAVVMLNAYCFNLPPQMGFTYQLMNSRIQKMETKRFAGVSASDRARMVELRSELNGNQLTAIISFAVEPVQFLLWTRPVALGTLGYKGEKILSKISKHSSAEEISKVAVKKNGDLFDRMAKAAFTFERVGVVKGTREAKDAIFGMLKKNLADEYLKDPVTLKKFYLQLKDQIDRELQSVIRGEAKMSKVAVEELDSVSLTVDDIIIREKARVMAGEESAFTVIYKKDYGKDLEKAAKKLEKSEKAAAAKIIARRARRETLLQERAALEKYIENIDQVVPESGESAISAFTRNWSVSDLELHRSFFSRPKFMFEKYSNDFYDLTTRKAIRKVYRQYDYLTEDWGKASNARAKALGQLFRGGSVNFYIDPKTGEFDKLYLKDFEENPEDYVVNTLRVPKDNEMSRFQSSKEPLREDLKTAISTAKKQEHEIAQSKALADALDKALRMDRLDRAKRGLPAATPEELKKIEEKVRSRFR